MHDEVLDDAVIDRIKSEKILGRGQEYWVKTE